MINFDNLRNFAENEYIKQNDNYISKYYDLLEEEKKLKNTLKIANISEKDTVRKQLEEIHELLSEYLTLGLIDVSQKSFELLNNPKYLPLLAEKAKELGNPNLAKTELIKTIQELELFSNMWTDLCINSEENILKDLNKFLVGYDIILDLISKEYGDNIVNVVVFNRKFSNCDMSLAAVLYDRVNKFGKARTMELLNDCVNGINPNIISMDYKTSIFSNYENNTETLKPKSKQKNKK